MPPGRLLLPALATAPLAGVPASAHAAGKPASVPKQVVGRASPPSPPAPQAAERAGVGAGVGTAPAPHPRVLGPRAGQTGRGAARRLRRQPGVAYAVPNYVARA